MNLDQLLIMPLMSGSILSLTGVFMYIFPPKKINALYGYRTRKSMQNQKQWDFSQIYSAKLLIIFGAMLALSSLLGFIFTFEESTALIISISLLLLEVVLILLLTEKAITKKFSS